ncbi:hypothetical protein ACFY36_00225 [Actinoplanes sp. NPDC000266]
MTIAMRTPFRWVPALTVAILVGVAGCSAGGARASAAGASATSAELAGTVEIRDLHNLFTADRSRAQDQCYGHTVTVRAVVLSTGASKYGTPAIEASDAAGGPHLGTFVLPYDGRRAESFRRLESVEDGREIVVTGSCNVFSDRTNVLIFKDTRIVG